MSEMKNSLGQLTIGLNASEEKISELEDIQQKPSNSNINLLKRLNKKIKINGFRDPHDKNQAAG